MLGLAEYAMRGRRQAVVTVFISGLIPLANVVLSPALVALVILRHGAAEGARVFVWALLPALAWAMGDVTSLIVLIGVSLMAVTLRRSSSWQQALLMAIVVAIGAQLTVLFNQQFVEQLELIWANSGNAELLAQLQSEDLPALVSSLFGLLCGGVSIGLLILARWWQARLYNPGGFGAEFRQLRLDYRVAAVLMLLYLLGGAGVPLLQQWMLYFVLPLFFASLALVHGIVHLKQLSRVWMVAFYVLLMTPLLMMLLVLAALVDSWYDFRRRVKPAV